MTANEAPLFIDPGSDDPAAHIGFREEYPYAIGGDLRGEATWRALRLDRADLAERRRDRLQDFRTLRSAAQLLSKKRDRESSALAAQIRAQLRHWLEDKAEYAAMIRADAAGGWRSGHPARR